MAETLHRFEHGTRTVTIDGARLWKQTYTGRAFDLMCFGPADIDLFGDVAESLARLCRYGGHVQCGLYSVAQHSVVGCDAALAEYPEEPEIAAYVLLHDVHEYIIGDITTPVSGWLSALEAELYGTTVVARSLLDTAKHRIDMAVWRAAGLPPPDRRQSALVKDYDLRLLATEQRQLLMAPPRSWGAEIDAARPIRMRGRLSAWSVAKAADAFRARLDMLCPTAMRL